MTISLDDVEYERYKLFSKEHYDKHQFPGGVPVTITPTGIGSHVEVKCPKCGKTKDISNYDVW
jgi:hypothetical protein